jgi:hypothetical protein
MLLEERVGVEGNDADVVMTLQLMTWHEDC